MTDIPWQRQIPKEQNYTGPNYTNQLYLCDMLSTPDGKYSRNLNSISQVKNTKTKRMMKRTTKKAIIMICPFKLAFFRTIATLFCESKTGEKFQSVGIQKKETR